MNPQALDDNAPASRPTTARMDQALRLMRPLRWLTNPDILGLDNIPDQRPLLFVGNHTLFGMLDMPLLGIELYARRGIILRPLGDRIHFQIPLWRRFSKEYGGVLANPQNCAHLIRQGECILVFPGGGREVSKRKGEKYRLIWKDRIGFARIAIEHGCPIVPFAAIGIEDAFDILVDADEILASPLRPLIDRLGVRHDLIMPIVKGLGPTLLPRPERLYFRFSPPIDTTEYQGQSHDLTTCMALRDRVKASIEEGISALLAHREQDPQRRLLPRIANTFLGR